MNKYINKAFLNEEGKFNCIKFKDELQVRLWKKNKVKN
jgi:hypothetical protein